MPSGLGLLDELLQYSTALITADFVLFNRDNSGLFCSKCEVYTALSTHTVDEELPENSNTQNFCCFSA